MDLLKQECRQRDILDLLVTGRFPSGESGDGEIEVTNWRNGTTRGFRIVSTLFTAKQTIRIDHASISMMMAAKQCES
ncbi:hypothetical protein CFB89_13835 [Burkholderia sp. AU16741]|uniref:hypothetical protein n=1 Tax=unclassified Burkholderia TaxID=2613784 RepID=UPI000B7AACF8|nr:MULTISPECIES: hypothetical protein [unclassified Burkholderia]MDN7430080.1 hypothetical protein [Burkholderia sp. AU45388]OXI32213.1 hypothetical protein CFB89_13835 [Burkholderia sp. AU16741]